MALGSLINPVSANGTRQPPDPDAQAAAAALIAERLSDPKIAASLSVLLDHVDLLAVLVSGLDGLVSRGDTITDSLASGITEIRTAGGQHKVMTDATRLLEAGRQLSALTPVLLDRLPVVERLLGSDLADPRVIDIAGAAARAVVTGAEQAQGTRISGIRSLLRVLKDPDVGRGLGFVVSIARAFGKQLGQDQDK